jgi:hypothetical protein
MDIAVIDVATDRYERVIHDSRVSSPGRYGIAGTLSLDENGDLYVYGHASFGSNPAQTQGILRIRRGATRQDRLRIGGGGRSGPLHIRPGDRCWVAGSGRANRGRADHRVGVLRISSSEGVECLRNGKA